jgi:hypothetical protein
MQRIAIFDPTNKVKAWIEEGHGVHVWRNADLSSANVGTLAFTRGDTEAVPPHWRYGRTPERTITKADECLFYIGSKASFTLAEDVATA